MFDKKSKTASKAKAKAKTKVEVKVEAKVEAEAVPVCTLELCTREKGGKTMLEVTEGDAMFTSTRMREIVGWMEDRMAKHI